MEINAIWGMVYALTKYVSPAFPPISLFAIRFLLGGVIGSVVNFKNLMRVRLSWEQFGMLCAFSTAFALSCYLVAIALPNLDSSVVSILERGETIITILFGVMFFKEKLSLKAISGIFLCFLALYLISAGGGRGNIFSVGVMFLACICGAISNILSKKINISNKSKVALSFLINGIELSALSYVSGEKIILNNLDHRAIISVIFLVIFSSYFCYLGLYYLLEKYDVGKVMPFKFIVPAVSILTGFVVLGEAITIIKIISLVLIIIGVTLTQCGVEKDGERKI
jgi:O-acetylserine/cysteine efflux transporter